MTVEDDLAKLGLMHVPRVAELVAEGLAKEIVEEVGKSRQKRTAYKISKKGQKRINEAMAHNAEILRALEVDYQAAHKKELRWRAEADRLGKLRFLASKGI